MTEDELVALEAMRAGVNLWEFEGSYIEVGPDESEYICAMSEAMPRLIAEVRRQRAVLADLARCDAEIFRIMGHEAELPQEES